VRKLRVFNDGSYVAADTGRIDDWRISIYDAGGSLIRTPTDAYCFDYFLGIGKNQEVFDAILKLAAQVGKDESIVTTIQLPNFKGTVEEQRVFAAYVAMLVAEENRILKVYGREIPTKLGKKVKIVGAYQVLVEGMSSNEAARWSVGRRWQEIAARYDEITSS
jgi:hypothetical protein